MEITLKDLLAEIRNLSFLFYGYTVVWVLLLGYLIVLARRERGLREQVEELRKQIEADPTK